LEKIEMKKTLVAIAALASVSAFAQTTVTLSGLVDMNYGSVTAPANAILLKTGNVSRVAMNGAGTTAFLFQATDDLGGGLTASFRYEMNPDFVNGSGVVGGVTGNASSRVTATNDTTLYGNGANGYNFVGISSNDFGGVKLGRLNTGTLTAFGDMSVFGTALGSGFGSAGIFTRYQSSTANYNNTAPTRFNGAVEYQSPAMNGLTVRYLYVPQVDINGIGGENGCLETACTTAGGNTATPGVNKAGVTDASVRYSNGPMNVTYAVQQIKTGAGDTNSLINPALMSTASTNLNHTTIAGNYKVANFTGYLGYWSIGAGTTYSDKGQMIGAKYEMGNVDFRVSTARNNSSLTGTSSAAADRKILGYGADYNFSKKSKVYVRFESRNADTGNTVTTAGAVSSTQGATTKTTAIGIQTNF